MRLPWQDKTGLAKATAIFASVLGISLGLCGANFFAILNFAFPSGPQQGIVAELLWGAAGLELLAIFVSIVGLIGIFIVQMVRK